MNTDPKQERFRSAYEGNRRGIWGDHRSPSSRSPITSRDRSSMQAVARATMRNTEIYDHHSSLWVLSQI
jgi:hypothetical protein